jgi:hypothetical protein
MTGWHVCSRNSAFSFQASAAEEEFFIAIIVIIATMTAEAESPA